MNFTPITFYNHTKKNIILPPNHSETLRSSSSYGNRFIKTSSSPKIYNANSFGMKVHQDIFPKFLNSQTPTNNTFRYTSNNNNKIIDYDKLQDENLKLKVELNKRLKDYNQLKVEVQRLEDENKRNNKIIEDFIAEASKFNPEIETINEEIKTENDNNSEELAKNFQIDYTSKTVSNNRNTTALNSFSSVDKKLKFHSVNIANIIKLREVFMINNLKRQINSYRQIVKDKDEELNSLKLNSKVSKYQNLETEFKTRNEELFMLKNNYKKINEAFSEQDNRFRELSEEKEYYKNNFSKIKFQLDEYRNKLKFSTEELSKLQKFVIEKKLEKKPINNVIINTNDSRIDQQLLESLKIERDRFESKLHETEALIAKLDEKSNKKAIKAQQLEEKLEDKLKQFQELENEVVLLKASNRDIELKNIDFQNKLDLIKNQLNSKDSQIEKLLQSIMDHNSKIYDLESKLLEEQEKSNLLDNKYKENDERTKILQDKVSDLERKLIDAEKLNVTLQIDLKNKIKEFKDKIEELKKCNVKQLFKSVNEIQNLSFFPVLKKEVLLESKIPELEKVDSDHVDFNTQPNYDSPPHHLIKKETLKDRREEIKSEKSEKTPMILARLEKKTKSEINLNSKLDINQKMLIKSPIAERNLLRKDSGGSLKLQIPNFLIAIIPPEDNKKDTSSVNMPVFSYQLSVQESEPQDCNPAENFFVKSGVNSRRQSKVEIKKPEKKKEVVENEFEKMITERMKKGEDFDSIFKDVNLKPLSK